MGPPLDSPFSRDPGEMVKAFFYVTILHDRAVFDYLAAKVGRDRLVVGSDYAFTIEQDQPAEFAEKELAVPREIFESNARRWLGLGS